MKNVILLIIAIVSLSSTLAFCWGTDIPIWTDGQVNCFDVDYAMDGTMFVAFQISGENNFIRIYYSTDHGLTWNWEGNFVIGNPRVLNRIRFLYLESGKYLAFYVEGDGNLYCWIRDLNTHIITKIKISESPILEGSFDVTLNLNDSRIFATWTEGNDAGDNIYVKYSDDDGSTWNTSRFAVWGKGGEPRRSITYGPPGNIFNAYSTLIYGPNGSQRNFMEIALKQSDNNGATWSSAIRLTENNYLDLCPRVAAANVDGSGVWVVYDRDRGGHEIDLHFRYSPDNGQNWYPREYTISADNGVDEYVTDLKFYKDYPNSYMNMVYIYDDPSASPIRKAIWLKTTTENPTVWRENQVVNDQDVQPWPDDVAPRIVYSPGATSSGSSGVVFSYIGRNGLYFDAPWIGAPMYHTLTCTILGSAMGIITSIPDGMYCFNEYPGWHKTCTWEFPYGITVELIATPVDYWGYKSYFMGWDGDCFGATCELIMDSNKEVFAEFMEVIPLLARFHAGGTIPLGSFNTNYDPSYGIKLSFDYHFSSKFSAMGLFGYHSFKSSVLSSDDTYWVNISADLKYDFTKKVLRPYINVGPGIYIPKNGTIKAGFNVGSGLDYFLTPKWAIELGADYHHVFNSGSDIEFSVPHIGLIYRF